MQKCAFSSLMIIQ